MTETPTPEEIEALVHADPPAGNETKAVPITLFTVVGKRFHVPDFNSWGYVAGGQYVFADGYFVDDNAEPEGDRVDVLLPSTSILWIQLHFDALNETDDVIDGTVLDGTEAS